MKNLKIIKPKYELVDMLIEMCEEYESSKILDWFINKIEKIKVRF